MMSSPVHAGSLQNQTWATVVAIEHAIHRARKPGLSLVELDLDKLRELHQILVEARKPVTYEATIKLLTSDGEGGLDGDQLDQLATCLRNSTVVRAWLPQLNLALAKKFERLEESLGSYVDKTSKGQLLGRPNAPEEFVVLENMMHELAQLNLPLGAASSA